MRRDQTPDDQPDRPDDDGGSDSGGESAGVVGLRELADEHHAFMRRALAAFRQIAAEGDVSGSVGLSPSSVLSVDHRVQWHLVQALELVASRLAVMPAVAAVYDAGVIEFDDLAAVVRGCASLSGRPLAEVDGWAALRAHELAAQRLLHLLDADVAGRVEQLRAPGWARRAERRAEVGSEVRGQQDFDGGGLIVASGDAVFFSTVYGTLEAVAGPPAPDRSRPGQRADALVAVCEHALAGTDATGPCGCPTCTRASSAAGSTTDADHCSADADGSDTDGRDTGGDDGDGRTVTVAPKRGQVRLPARPRPRVTVVVDLAQATVERFALLTRLTGLAAAPTLSARLADVLAADAELLVQLADGRRPLAELVADDIPAAVRRAVIARDRGCRAPGCARPPHECDLHHIVPRAEDGPHDPDNLIALCRADHRAVDRHSWAITLDPTTATVTWAHPRSTRLQRTVPHGARPPPRRPDGVPLADWEAPPVPPVPPEHPPDPHDPALDPTTRPRPG